MHEYGLDLVDLTGRWVGFYRHRWEQLGTYAIVADLNQNGTRITGEMYDQITERSDYLDDYVDLIGKDIPHESRRRLEQMVRRFGAETVHNARLPDTSDIRGSIQGSQVRFTKTYRGAMEITVTVGDKLIGSASRRNHKVQYAGELDLERMCLTGRWTIRHGGLLGWVLPPQGWGPFELYRKL
jgi:hypothetical protein